MLREAKSFLDGNVFALVKWVFIVLHIFYNEKINSPATVIAHNFRNWLVTFRIIISLITSVNIHNDLTTFQ